MLKITKVIEGCVGEEIGLVSGDTIMKINDRECDLLDYIYCDGEGEIKLEVITREGCETTEIEMDAGETLGLEFEQQLKTISCKNNCVFCFISQLPKNLRKTLYVKDDDWRLSLISGNYVTLTNLEESDLERIITMKYSPLYVSVHCTDSDIRAKMLRNENSKNIMSQLKRLSDGGIKLHCQIVLCPTYNDGDILRRTLSDLSGIKNVATVAVVPVGKTKYRQGLAEIPSVSEEIAVDTVRLCESFSREDFKVFASDEMYILSKLPFPNSCEYGEYDQIENGVGIVSKFIAELNECKAQKSKGKKTVVIACGISAATFVEHAAEVARAAGANARVIPIYNDFFGRSVTVSGLITGGDLYNQLKDIKMDRLIIPHVMLKEFGDQFLDDMTLDELRNKLQVEILVSNGSAEHLLKLIAGK